MGSRIDLQNTLEDILQSKNVYFQPPETLRIDYPAIIYGLSDIDSTHANNNVYNQVRSYTVTLIDEDPDSEFIKSLSYLQTCRFDRHYKSDNLNHYVYKLYY